jgi:hypothetical protein
MAKTQNSAEDIVARGADVPLALATQATTRDALTDPREGDIIPDVDTKGYHVGEVRQPAEPVLTRGGDVQFESLGDTGPSKFPSSYAEEQAAMDKRLSSDPAYAGTVHVPVHADPDTADAAYRERLAADKPSRSSRDTGTGRGNVASDLDSDSANVAGKQAREDKS